MLKELSTRSSRILKSPIFTYATENRVATTPELKGPEHTRHPNEIQMSDQKVVLITGASSGVGQSTARLLSHKGFKVFGTSRNPDRAQAIRGVRMLALD